MVINLKGAWYHYCQIDPGTVTSLLAAESMGRVYNKSIAPRPPILTTPEFAHAVYEASTSSTAEVRSALSVKR